MDLYEALKVGLISMDSTMRSNIGVGLPIDIAVIRRGALLMESTRRIEPGEAYFHDLRERWSAALRAARKSIPRPPYGPDDR
jgi:putative proteasome-type protease